MEAIVLIVMIILFIAAVLGYCLNFVKLVKSDYVKGITLLRLAGVFAFPIGCIVGYVNG